MRGFCHSFQVALILYLCLPAPFSWAVITEVPNDYPTIQQAIDASTHGDEIIVSPGTYLENIHFNGKNIILRSTEPTNPDAVAATIIDGRSSDTVVTFSGIENESCVLSGFTLTNGSAGSGGGINGKETMATIQYNIITTNTAYGYWPDGLGGGLYLCHGTIRLNTIANNSAYRGGGLWDCDGIIRDNTIVGNSARNNGAGLSWCDGTILNNVILNNSATMYLSSTGGGLWGCNGWIQNNTISGNTAQSGGGLSGCNGVIHNNIISHNSVSYFGGGLGYCNGTIQNNTISANLATGYYAAGGGVYGCDGIIQNNIISGNSASRSGGGLSQCEATIQSNTISGNSAASSGGGVYWSNGAIQNNTIMGNSAGEGGGLFYCHEAIRNCIIWGNSATDGPQLLYSSLPSYSCIEAWTGEGIGNISSDPLFMDPGNEDYHLQAGSPCIDAGISGYWFCWPQWDCDGNCRLAGTSVDMGCYEYGSQPDGDGDLLSDNDEIVHGTDPNIADSDGDGLRDGLEIIRGSDPLSPTPAGTLNVPSEVPMIQLALAVSREGEEIVVAPGVYYENLEFFGTDIVLRSLDPSNPVIVSATIIDGSSWISVVTFTGGETSDCILSGFTIRNGGALQGGGINGQRTNATIEHCLIASNSAGDAGGGLYRCDGIMQNNTITGNSASYGGGLSCCDGTIQDNTIVGNSAGEDGGGLYRCDGIMQNNTITGNSASYGGGLSCCDGTIQDNTIVGNSASYGGGLFECDGTIQNTTITGNLASHGGGLYECDGLVQNTTITGNSASYGGGLLWCDGTIQNNSIANNSAASSGGGLCGCDGAIQNNTITGNSAGEGGGLFYCHEAIRNCIIWGNSATDGPQLLYSSFPAYSCIEAWSGEGIGNISSDPLFVDSANGDYHLQAGSPCIDAGISGYWFCWPQWDCDGNCRLAGTSVDMGCYEYGSQPDSDGDLLSDSEEALHGTDPNVADSDGDGLRDGLEIIRGSDPLSPTPAGTLNVPSEFPTIQLALAVSREGDEIVVAPGVYYENLECYGPDIVLRSLDPSNPLTVSETIIDGSSRSSVVTFTGGETSDCILSGFTIRNGSALQGGGIKGQRTNATIQHCHITGNSARSGGGLYWCYGIIENNAITGNSASYGGGLSYCRGTIQNNTIEGNSAAYDGGGLDNCHGTIQNNSITGNSAQSGGGLCDCDGPIQNNTILDNSAGQHGGGLYGCGGTIQNNTITGNSAMSGGGLNHCNGIIQNNTISGNSARSAGGLHDCDWTIRNNIILGNIASDKGGALYWCDGTIQNNTISGNSASYGGGLRDCRADIVNCIITNNENCGIYESHEYYDPDEVRYCDLYGNTGGDYFDADTATSYTGIAINELPEVHDCISADPLFVDPGSPTAPDFHLRDDSLCIDAGDPDTQYNDGCLPPGKGTERNDMGAYGGPENCGWLWLYTWNFESTQHNWQFETLSPGPHHVEHWEDGFPTTDTRSIGISSPYDESTNYFALWSSVNADAIPYYDNALYKVDWLFSTNRQSTNCVPSLRFRIGLKNQKAFSFSRIYPGEWLPLAQRPGTTPFSLCFEPPIASPEGLFLAFSLIDCTDDFRQSSPAGAVYLEEVSVYRYYLDEFTDWQELLSLGPADFVDWQSSTAPPYDEPGFLYDTNGLSITSTIPAARVFGCWKSPLDLFTLAPSKVYRLRSKVSSSPQLGGPELRLRVHTDDYRYAWYTHYVSSYTPGESALPPEEGADYDLYLTLPFATQPCHVSFDLIDFSDSFGGTLTLHDLSLHSHPF